eukprot:577224-Rhodomonas_salina.4
MSKGSSDVILRCRSILSRAALRSIAANVWCGSLNMPLTWYLGLVKHHPFGVAREWIVCFWPPTPLVTILVTTSFEPAHIVCSTRTSSSITASQASWKGSECACKIRRQSAKRYSHPRKSANTATTRTTPAFFDTLRSNRHCAPVSRQSHKTTIAIWAVLSRGSVLQYCGGNGSGRMSTQS